MIVLDDLNAAVNTLFVSEHVNMCNTHQLVVSDYEAYGRDSGQFTYVSDVHFTTSWLDPVLCSQDIQSKLVSVKILDKLPSSDHLPISITLLVNVHLQCFVSASSVYSSTRDKVIFNWAKASIDDINEYCVNTYTNFLLQFILFLL